MARTTKRETRAGLEVTVGREELVALLETAAAVASSKSTMTILTNALLRSDGDRLTATATDLYQTIASSIAAEVAGEGSLAVPARDLLARIRVMSGDRVTLSVDDGRVLTVRTEGGAKRKFTVRGIDVAEFPPVPMPKMDVPGAEIPARALADQIGAVIASVSEDTTRPHMNSMLLEWGKGTLRAASTDGHRLTRLDADVDGGALAGKATMLVALPSAKVVRKICGDAAEGATVRVRLDGSTVFFDVGDATFGAKLVDAQFPPYDQVTPKQKDQPTTVRVNREALLDAVRAVAVAASSKVGAVKLAVGGRQIAIAADGTEVGSGADEVEAETSGPPVTIGFNARYVADALDSAATETVVLGLRSELDPLTVRRADGGDTFVAVIMPTRI